MFVVFQIMKDEINRKILEDEIQELIRTAENINEAKSACFEVFKSFMLNCSLDN